MPDMTCLYSVFGIFFESAAAGFGYRIHLHIVARSPHKFFHSRLRNCYIAFRIAEHI